MSGLRSSFSTRAIYPPERETELKDEFFAGAGGGYFVEVGANDPTFNSQTWHLERAGWTGILVEPQHDLAETLRRSRKAQVYAIACSSPALAGGTARIQLAGPYSTLERNLAVAGMHAEASLEVPVRTLDDVLVEALAPIPIDFLSIDVEGHEPEVLAGFDLARWRPRLILIEDHVVSLAAHRLLTRAGYRLVRRTGLNGWYVPRAEAGTLGWFGRWQIFRKYYLGLPFRRLRDALRRLRASRPQRAGFPKLAPR
jgi:FkbM family methyltransferase